MLFSVFLSFFLASANAALMHKGVDWFSMLVEEASGKSYIGIDGNTKPLEKILHNNGATTVRQRLWYNPSDGNYDLDYNLKLAKRAQAAGFKIYLDIFFRNTWTEPANQATPAAWEG